MGVWIETKRFVSAAESFESHPVWVCGLKLISTAKMDDAEGVTPCMGVWIETIICFFIYSQGMSHPVWVCGLKLIYKDRITERRSSHPVWVCGLKLSQLRDRISKESHTLYGCVD